MIAAERHDPIWMKQGDAMKQADVEKIIFGYLDGGVYRPDRHADLCAAGFKDEAEDHGPEGTEGTVSHRGQHAPVVNSRFPVADGEGHSDEVSPFEAGRRAFPVYVPGYDHRGNQRD